MVATENFRFWLIEPVLPTTIDVGFGLIGALSICCRENGTAFCLLRQERGTGFLFVWT
jgi:hypothetical protein